jgi:hypothetical protein
VEVLVVIRSIQMPGKMKMVKKGKRMVPAFAADGVGKMGKGGSMDKKGRAMKRKSRDAAGRAMRGK